MAAGSSHAHGAFRAFINVFVWQMATDLRLNITSSVVALKTSHCPLVVDEDRERIRAQQLHVLQTAQQDAIRINEFLHIGIDFEGLDRARPRRYIFSQVHILTSIDKRIDHDA